MTLINIKSGILVLLFISVLFLTIALFFTHKEVRNMKVSLSTHSHDIKSIYGIFNNVGDVALGGQQNSSSRHLHTIPEGDEPVNEVFEQQAYENMEDGELEEEEEHEEQEVLVEEQEEVHDDGPVEEQEAPVDGETVGKEDVTVQDYSDTSDSDTD